MPDVRPGPVRRRARRGGSSSSAPGRGAAAGGGQVRFCRRGRDAARQEESQVASSRLMIRPAAVIIPFTGP